MSCTVPMLFSAVILPRPAAILAALGTVLGKLPALVLPGLLRQCLFNGKADLLVVIDGKDFDRNSLPNLEMIRNIADINRCNFRNMYHPYHTGFQLYECSEFCDSGYFAFCDFTYLKLHKTTVSSCYSTV